MKSEVEIIRLNCSYKVIYTVNKCRLK